MQDKNSKKVKSSGDNESNNLADDLKKVEEDYLAVKAPAKERSTRRRSLLFVISGLALLLVVGGLLWQFQFKQNSPVVDDPTTPEYEDANSAHLEKLEEIEQAGEEVASADLAAVVYTTIDIVEHDSLSDCWMAVENEVYDITDWQYGGATSKEEFCGNPDGRQILAKDNHPKPSSKYLKGYYDSGS